MKMTYRIIIATLLLINAVLSRNFGSWEKSNDFDHGLGWLFDIEEPENNENEIKMPKVCQTNACKILGNQFLQGMNKSINPCDNFYDYVCGAWQSNFKIPEYSPVWSTTHMFQETVFYRIKGILEAEPDNNDILPVSQAKKWYGACMNEDGLERRGIKPLESILIQVGGWPMTIDVEEWDESGHSWQSIEQHYFHLTDSYIFYDINPYYTKDNGIQIFKPDLPLFDKLPFKYRNYTGNKYNEYMELIENIAQIFIDHNRAHVTKEMMKKDIEGLIHFEKQLYLLTQKDDRSSEYADDEPEYETIDEFIKGYEEQVDSKLNRGIIKINFRKLIKNKFDMIGLDVNDSMPIDGEKLNYYTNLTELLNKTPKRTLVNYIHWYFVSEMLTYTTERMRNELFKYEEHVLGISERTPRWVECLLDIDMRDVLTYVFVKKYFSKDTEKSAREIIDNIREEMKLQILGTNWMNQHTINVTVDMLESMTVSLGFPDRYKNKTFILNMYKGLVIGYDHFDNVLSYEKFSIRQRWRHAMINRPDNTNEFDPLAINAFYDPETNYIALPAAYFQPPLFTPKLPSVISYGSVGSVIGHEIGHVIDINGIQYGKHGRSTNISKQFKYMFYKRAECFIHQFNKYYGVIEAEDATSKFINQSKRNITKSENMADSIGLHAVIEAYKKMSAKYPQDIKIPGFEEFTDDQMLFISFGAYWCEISTPEFAEMNEKDNEHSSARLRVIGAVSNSYEFARAFKCPKDSPMNPENKCNIWKSTPRRGVKKTIKNFRHPWILRW